MRTARGTWFIEEVFVHYISLFPIMKNELQRKWVIVCEQYQSDMGGITTRDAMARQVANYLMLISVIYVTTIWFGLKIPIILIWIITCTIPFTVILFYSITFILV